MSVDSKANGGLTRAAVPRYRQRSMNVIVNADDLGMSLAVNDAVFRSFDAGLLQSTSVLVHGPAFRDAVLRLDARPGLRVGLHLDSTEFAPTTASLLDTWRLQLRIARDAGLAPTHLDSHHHVHLRWASLGALRRLCGESGIRRVRGRSLDFGASVRSRLWRELVARFAAMPDHFSSMERTLATGAPGRPGWTEVMVHPGNPHHARYAREMLALADAAPGWTLGSFDHIGDSGHRSQPAVQKDKAQP
ncbi:MAG: ChbG/HpnK family deacetylase [Myxococcales bacterium]|nr:ChbG/HpnK family deacetylase [Myxococcales bacterium]